MNFNAISSVEVTYYTPSKIIETKSFNPKTTFQEITKHFYAIIKPKNENLELKNNYYFKKNKINKSVKIIYLFNGDTNTNNGKVNLYVELKDNNETNGYMKYLFKPKSNPFGILIYSINTNKFILEDLSNDIIQSNNLDKYNPEYSAYCNSNDALFISGGVGKNRARLNDLWIIKYNSYENKDKGKFVIKNIKMPFNKKQHSMLYNKIDNSIIFAGGNDKKCFVFDIKTEKFSELPETNEVCLKPALLIKNNYLYIFDSFNRKKKFFEKMNLETKRQFEKFYPKNYGLYRNVSFGVCESNSEDSIIFCGGERNGNNTLTYEINNNDIIESKGKDLITTLDDKTFYKINTNYFANIPDSNGKEEKSIIVIDLKTHDANKLIFDTKGKTSFKFETNEESDISIEPLITKKKYSHKFTKTDVPLENEKLTNDKSNDVKSNSKIESLPEIKTNSLNYYKYRKKDRDVLNNKLKNNGTNIEQEEKQKEEKEKAEKQLREKQIQEIQMREKQKEENGKRHYRFKYRTLRATQNQNQNNNDQITIESTSKEEEDKLKEN